MLLATDLPLRKDGGVTADVPGEPGQPAVRYTFVPNEAGQTVAEVADDDHIGYLLDTGNFYPADDSDSLEAVAIVTSIDTSPQEKKPGKSKKKG